MTKYVKYDQVYSNTSYGQLWSSKAIISQVWPSMAQDDRLWSNVVNYGLLFSSMSNMIWFVFI